MEVDPSTALLNFQDVFTWKIINVVVFAIMSMPLLGMIGVIVASWSTKKSYRRIKVME